MRPEATPQPLRILLSGARWQEIQSTLESLGAGGVDCTGTMLVLVHVWDDDDGPGFDVKRIASLN